MDSIPRPGTTPARDEELLLSEILEALLAARDPDAVVRELAPKVAAHVGADAYFNFMLNRAGDALELAASHGVSEEVARSIGQLKVGHLICGTVAQTWRPIVANNIQANRDEKAAAIREYGMQTYACYPLLAGDRLLGTLSFGSRRRTRFDDEELDFLASVARCAAIALDRLYSERAVRESSRFTRRVLDNLFAFVGVLAADGTVLDANAAPLEAAGMTMADVAGKKFWDCSWWNYSPAVQAQLQNACERARQGEVVRYDVAVRMAADTRMMIDFQVAPLHDDDGHVTHLVPSGMDITARVQAEEASRAAEHRYRTLFDSIDEAFCVLEVRFDENQAPVDFRHLETNPAFEKHTGLEGARGKWVKDLVPDLQHSWIEAYGKVALTGEPVRFEDHAPALNRWFEVYAFRPDPRHPAVAVLFQNTTERKLAEKALRHTEAQRAAIIEQSPVGIYLVDSRFRIQHVNAKALPVFRGIENLIGSDFAEIVHKIWPPEAAADALAKFRRTLETGESYFSPGFAEDRVDTGEREYYDWEIHRVAFPDGHFGVACYFTDITAHVLAQLKIRESEQRLRFMAESMPVKIFTTTPSGEADYMNGQWLEFTGLTLAESVGWNWARVLHPSDVEETLRRWKDAVAAGRSFEMEHRFRRHDGAYLWHLTRAHAMRNAEGDVIMWIGSNTEIDDQKRAEEKLEEIVEERTVKLREAVAELEHFSYTITHDMRAPLRAMRGFGEILLEEAQHKLDPSNQNYLRRIMAAASRMDHLIRDALNYSKVARDELTLLPVDPECILRDMIDSYPAFQEPTARIVIEGKLPVVMANEAGLGQCFSNLLNNAVKFVETGTTPRVHIRAETREGFVRLWFEDNGIGIMPQYQEQIFGMFQRLNKDYAGTGIGLALVRKVIERMSGQIGVESKPGEGSRFWLDLRSCERSGHSSPTSSAVCGG